MDPYLEDPRRWPDVHHRLISVTSDLLMLQLRPRYFVRIEERVYISDERDPGRQVIVPDLHVLQRPGSFKTPAPASESGVQVAEPIVAVTMIRDQIRESRLQIIDGATRDVVTVIEVLSPANKVNGSRGRQSYEEKRDSVLDSPTHLVEIDLLRAGERVVPSPRAAFNYILHVSRSENRPRGMLWPIRLAQRLPVIPIPLHADDQDVTLDLQAAIDTAYDGAAYDLEIDYQQQANPPLASEDADWADGILRAKNLR